MPLDIIVIGGGIGGLTAAISLLQAGHNVKIFEKSQFAAEVGAAVALAPNGARVLSKLGFSFKRARAMELLVWDSVDGITLEMLAAVDQRQNRDKWGFPMMSIHRVDLHNELLRLLSESSPNALQLDSAVVAVDADAGSITLKDGSIHTADIIVGADGLHSVARSLLVKESPPKATGLSAFRFLIPTAIMEADPKTRQSLSHKSAGPTIYADTTSYQERHMVWYSCRDGEVQSLAGIHPTRQVQPANADSKWFQAELSSEFAHFHTDLTNLFPAAEAVKCWELRQADPLPTWTYGKLILVGDAAHPMLPFSGQGSNQAMEDAGALGYMTWGAKISDIPTRLKLFEAVRLKRAARVQTLSRVRAGQEAKVHAKLKAWADSPEAPVPATFAERVDHDYGQVSLHFPAPVVHLPNTMNSSYDVYADCQRVWKAAHLPVFDLDDGGKPV